MVLLMATVGKYFCYIFDQATVIASYYLDCVSKLSKIIPMTVRSDRGSENSLLKF